MFIRLCITACAYRYLEHQRYKLSIYEGEVAGRGGEKWAGEEGKIRMLAVATHLL